MGTRMSSTSLLFSTKKRNFWGREEEGTGGRGQREHSSAPPPSRLQELGQGPQPGLSWPTWVVTVSAPGPQPGLSQAIHLACRTLLKSQSFQKRTSSSWWNWIFLVELGR